MEKREKILNAILPITAICCIVVIWAAAAKVVGSEYVLPSVISTFSALIDVLKTQEFYISYSMTFLRSIIAFIISFFAAFVLGLAAKKHKKFESFISPVISIIRTLPTIAVVLILLLWTDRFIAPVIVTMLVVFPTLYTFIRNALESVDGESVEMCKLYGVTGKNILLKVQIPQIMPFVFSACGTGLSLNLKLMVAAEVLAATGSSLGNMLNLSNQNLETAKMLALVLITVITGLIIEKVFKVISQKAVKWQ